MTAMAMTMATGEDDKDGNGDGGCDGNDDRDGNDDGNSNKQQRQRGWQW